MLISVIIPTIGKARVNKILPYWKDADEIIIIDNPKQQVVDNFKDGVKKAKGDILVFVNDRCIIKKGWRQMLEKEFTNFSGVVSFAPIYVTNGAISRDYLEKWSAGYILQPEYIHHFADLELAQKADELNMYKEVQNWIRCLPKEPKKVDQAKILKEVQWDVKTYWKRKIANFPNKILSNMRTRKKYIYVH
jgi:hypothetical protein